MATSPPPPPQGPPPPGGPGDAGPRAGEPPRQEPRRPPEPEALPWEERSRQGFVEGFLETAKLFILDPSEGFARARRTGDMGSPIFYGILVSWIGMVVYMVWQLVFETGLGMLSQMPAGQGFDPAKMGWIAGAGGLLVLLIVGPFLALIGLFISAGITHVFVMLVGGLENSDLGFEGTMRIVAYAQTAQIANAVPIVGGLAAFIWTIVLEVIGCVQVHRMSQGKALAAVLLPVVLCCLCGIGLAVALIGGVVAAAGAGGNVP